MEAQQALQNVDNIVAQVRMTRQEHFSALQDIETLQRNIHERNQLASEKSAAEQDQAAAEADEANKKPAARKK